MVNQVAAQLAASVAGSSSSTVKLQPGTEVAAKVVSSGPDSVVRLAVGKDTIDVRSSTPLPKGTEVTIKVEGTSAEPKIQLVTQGTQTSGQNASQAPAQTSTQAPSQTNAQPSSQSSGQATAPQSGATQSGAQPPISSGAQGAVPTTPSLASLANAIGTQGLSSQLQALLDPGSGATVSHSQPQSQGAAQSQNQAQTQSQPASVPQSSSGTPAPSNVSPQGQPSVTSQQSAPQPASAGTTPVSPSAGGQSQTVPTSVSGAVTGQGAQPVPQTSQAQSGTISVPSGGTVPPSSGSSVQPQAPQVPQGAAVPTGTTPTTGQGAGPSGAPGAGPSLTQAASSQQAPVAAGNVGVATGQNGAPVLNVAGNAAAGQAGAPAQTTAGAPPTVANPVSANVAASQISQAAQPNVQTGGQVSGQPAIQTSVQSGVSLPAGAGAATGNIPPASMSSTGQAAGTVGAAVTSTASSPAQASAARGGMALPQGAALSHAGTGINSAAQGLNAASQAASLSRPAQPSHSLPTSPQLQQMAEVLKGGLEQQQTSIGAVFAQATQVLNAVSSGTFNAPGSVKQALQQMLGLRLGDNGAKVTGEALQKAVAGSGVFREAGLAQGNSLQGGLDLKSVLLNLKTALQQVGVKHSGEKPFVKPSGPNLVSGPRGQQPMPLGLGGGEDAEQMLSRLLQDTDGALSRLRMAQMANRGLGADDFATQAARSMDLVVELPLSVGQETAIVQMQVGRDPDHDGEGDEDGRGWRLRFGMDLTATGPLEAAVSLRGGGTFVSLWLEREETYQSLSGQKETIEASFAEAGLDLQELRFIRGMPIRTKLRAGSQLDQSS